jgi:hypothetical protein
MDDIGGHHAGIFDSLINHAKDSHLNRAAHSLASVVGINAQWLTGEQSGIAAHPHDVHLDTNGTAPGDQVPIEGNDGNREDFQPGSSSARPQDQALIADILADADYLSTEK